MTGGFIQNPLKSVINLKVDIKFYHVNFDEGEMNEKMLEIRYKCQLKGPVDQNSIFFLTQSIKY